MPDELLTDAEKRVKIARLGRRTRIFQAMFTTAVVLYTLLAVLAHSYPYYRWDLATSRWIQAISLPGFGELMIFLSALGSGWVPFALVGATGLGLMLARFRTEAVALMSGVAFSSSMNQLLKILSGRPRPDGEIINVITEVRHNSFPSGHTVFFVVFFGFLLYLIYVLRLRPGWRRILSILLGSMIALIGVSRIYLGAHWLSDIVGGYLIGSIWLVLLTKVYSRVKQKTVIDNDPGDTPEL